MAEMNLAETPVTDSQVDCVLNDIAITANTIRRFAIMLAHADDERDIEALTRGIESLAERVGLLADMTTDKRVRGSGPVFGARPEVWMMPPSYHEANSNLA